MKMIKLVFLSGLFVMLWTAGFACTSFCINNDHQVFAAKSYDWHIGEGYLIKNNRGLKKTGFPFSTKHKVSWVSKYGSMTFNQYGKEFPIGGINEAGLVVEALWLSETKYPKSPRKGYISELEWVQYQLDNFGSIEEVIAALPDIMIIPVGGALHFFIVDENGASAVVEFLNNKIIVNRKTDRHQAITNDNYHDSQQYTDKRNKYKSAFPCKKSLCRYKTACQATASLAKQTPTPHQLFEVMDKVKIDGYTKWNIVYDICNRTIHFRSVNHPTIKKVEMGTFDYSPSSQVVFHDINSAANTNITHDFRPLTKEANLAMIEYTLPLVDVQLPFQPINDHQMRQSIALVKSDRLKAVK